MSRAAFSPIVRNALARLRACAERSTGGDVRVVLFGSYARGEADEHSDIDVLVVIAVENPSARAAIIDEAGELFAQTGVLVQPIVLTQDEHTRRLAGGEGSMNDFTYQLSRAVMINVLLMLVMGWAGHNLFRYNWQWIASFRSSVAISHPSSALAAVTVTR